MIDGYVGETGRLARDPVGAWLIAKTYSGRGNPETSVRSVPVSARIQRYFHAWDDGG